MMRQYGQWYFDIKDVIALEDLTLVGEKYCRVFLRNPKVVILRGQAAEQCLEDLKKRDDGGWTKDLK